MGKKLNLTNQKFGYLTVIKDSGQRTKDGKILWQCKCDCGAEHYTDTSSLRLGRTVSCGCKKRTNLVGQRFDRLTVIEDLHKLNEKHCKIYLCKCDCGNIIEVPSVLLTSGQKRSCGCLGIETRKAFAEQKKRKLIGQRFGNLLVIKESPKRGSHGEVYWICKCDCGNEIEVAGNNLVSDHTTSCGCNRTSIGEKKITQILKEHNILFNKEYTDKNCLLSTGGWARFDFKINNYYIEYDGKQHFEIGGWNTEEVLKTTQKRDQEKNEYCLKNNIPLIRIPYTHLKELCLEDLLLETSKYIYQEAPQE